MSREKTNCSSEVLRRGMRDINWRKPGLLTYKGIIYILNVVDLRRIVMDEIHKAPYSGHPGY